MNTKEVATLKRTCEAIEIPSGRKLTLFEGTEVIITQSLGGTYTVMTYQGVMASIAGKDGDALGKEVIEPPSGPPSGEVSREWIEQNVWAQLKTCYDPEIPHNIVDLGLVYECTLLQREDKNYKVDIKMTLTAPGCGMGEWLKQDAQNKVMSIPGVKECTVAIVFDPPWDRSKMHPALRREFM